MIFLVEYYEPDTCPAAVTRIAERARAAARELAGEGADLHFARATLVPAEQTSFLQYEARSAERVAAATRRAAIHGAHVNEVQEG